MIDRIDMTDSPEHHRQRSEFIRELVQRPASNIQPLGRYKQSPPKTIVQFWHDLRELPSDVKECISSWTRWTDSGFKHLLFDEVSARAFIRDTLNSRHEHAFDRCYHPAMQADYFRLCYLLVEGGFYVDADEVCIGSQLDWLFDDGRLKVHPLCYDIASATMVKADNFLPLGKYEPDWIFYLNNNPLIAARKHPIVQLALDRATELLQNAVDGMLPEIQSTTGPGNLSKSIFEFGAVSGSLERELLVLRDWDSFAVSRWPLSYRNDDRNWRLSNQKRLRRY